MGVMELLHRSGVNLAGKHAVVVGRSATVGGPVAQLLTAHDCTVTVCHSQTTNLQEHVSHADILVACCGRPRLIQGSWIKPGAGVARGYIGRLLWPAEADPRIVDQARSSCDRRWHEQFCGCTARSQDCRRCML